ncbi:MAG: ribonuclease HII [Candidatus Paceibacterota bacterium]|jgi:ribonuclease HII
MAKQARNLIGIDEVGRGPLAGPVTVCAFSVLCRGKKLPKPLHLAKDSKMLSPKRREEWFKVVKELAKQNRCQYAVSCVSEKVIDREGIAYAIRLAIARSLKKIGADELRSQILLDGGIKAPAQYINQQTIIGGDRKEPIIALASIVAKVKRDSKLRRYAKIFPQYGFEIHKGYGTRLHYQNLKKYGLSEIHRRSFLTKLLKDVRFR